MGKESIKKLRKSCSCLLWRFPNHLRQTLINPLKGSKLSSNNIWSRNSKSATLTTQYLTYLPTYLLNSKDLFIKNRSKHSSNTLLSLLRFFMNKSLIIDIKNYYLAQNLPIGIHMPLGNYLETP